MRYFLNILEELFFVWRGASPRWEFVEKYMGLSPSERILIAGGSYAWLMLILGRYAIVRIVRVRFVVFAVFY